MRLQRISLALLIGLPLLACGGGEPDDEESGNRTAASSSDSAPVDEPSDDDAAAAPSLVDPVSFNALLPLLPAAPQGWTAGTPEGSTTSLPDYKVTVVRNQYARAATDSAPGADVTIEMTDGGFAEAIAAPFQMMSMMSHESTTGYQKGITIGGNPAYETWDNGSRSCDINLLVGKRFLVHLASSQLDADELRAWAEGMDLAALADLAD
jgi:hypothetical protein